MFKFIDYPRARALQICIVFAFALAIQKLLENSHIAWIGFSVMMIYAGFDRSSSLHRTTHRFWGTVLGLLFYHVLLLAGQINYRVILVVIPIIVFMAFFSLGKRYAFPTIFTVTLTGLGIAYYGGSTFSQVGFFFDYFISDLIALILCVLFEYYIFIDSHLSHKFYLGLQKEIITRLNELFAIVTHQPLHRSRYLTMSTKLNILVLELYAVVETNKHVSHSERDLLEALALFSKEVQLVYYNIQKIYLFANQQEDSLVSETRQMIESLSMCNRKEQLKYVKEAT